MERLTHCAILVEYLESPGKGADVTVRGKVDYKDVLNSGDFSLYSKLREIRKN